MTRRSKGCQTTSPQSPAIKRHSAELALAQLGHAAPPQVPRHAKHFEVEAATLITGNFENNKATRSYNTFLERPYQYLFVVSSSHEF